MLRRKDQQEEDQEKQDQRRIPLVSKNNWFLSNFAAAIREAHG